MVVVVDGAVWFRGVDDDVERFASELLGLAEGRLGPRRRRELEDLARKVLVMKEAREKHRGLHERQERSPRREPHQQGADDGTPGAPGTSATDVRATEPDAAA